MNIPSFEATHRPVISQWTRKGGERIERTGQLSMYLSAEQGEESGETAKICRARCRQGVE